MARQKLSLHPFLRSSVFPIAHFFRHSFANNVSDLNIILHLLAALYLICILSFVDWLALGSVHVLHSLLGGLGPHREEQELNSTCVRSCLLVFAYCASPISFWVQQYSPLRKQQPVSV